MRHELGLPAAFRLLLFLGFIAKGCWGIRVSNMWVPPVVVSGSHVKLICDYEHRTDGLDPLYSVKWYRGVEQFYEYMPKKMPPVRVYQLANLDVDKDNSNRTVVVLKSVSRKTSGVYRCEVVSDKPLFETDDASRNMTVVDIPLWGPEMRGLAKGTRVRPGDVIQVRCIMGHSDPLAQVTWWVNSALAPPHAITTHTVQRDEKARLAQIFMFEMELDNESFLRGAVTLTCEAKVSTVYNETVNLTLIHADHPQPSEFGWFSAGSSVRSSLVALAATLGLVCLLVV